MVLAVPNNLFCEHVNTVHVIEIISKNITIFLMYSYYHIYLKLENKKGKLTPSSSTPAWFSSFGSDGYISGACGKNCIHKRTGNNVLLNM